VKSVTSKAEPSVKQGTIVVGSGRALASKSPLRANWIYSLGVTSLRAERNEQLAIPTRRMIVRVFIL